MNRSECFNKLDELFKDRMDKLVIEAADTLCNVDEFMSPVVAEDVVQQWFLSLYERHSVFGVLI